MLKRRILNMAALLIGGGLALTSCNDDSQSRGWVYMPDMYDGPAVEMYQPYNDTISARKPVEGTIPRGFMAYDHYAADQSGYDSAKVNLRMPADFPTDSMTLEDGAKLYGIFCAQCHGEKGDGMGVLVKNEVFLGVPNYADRDINEGSVFHVITYGKGVMGSHASQVTPSERWKITQHVLKLRAALTGDDKKAEENKEEAASTEVAATETTES